MKSILIALFVIIFLASHNILKSESIDKDIKIILDENQTISLRNFEFRFSIKNNTNEKILFDPNRIKMIDIFQVSTNPYSNRKVYDQLTYELKRDDIDLVEIPPKTVFKFKNNLNHVAKEIMKSSKNKKGTYFIAIHYEIQGHLYSNKYEEFQMTN